NIDWNLFPVFVEIIRAGGIGAAARRLNKQQPTISLALKRLEDSVGAPLCRRTARGIVPTAAGRALLASCETMLEAARRVPHQLAQAIGQVEGRVRLEMISFVVSPRFDQALGAFHARYPDVLIEIAVSPWRSVIDRLSAGEAELGIGYDSSDRHGLAYHRLLDETQQLYCARHHRLFGSRVADLGELAGERFISTGADEPEHLTRFRRRYGIGERPAGLAEDLHEARRLILAGVGIGFLPTEAAQSEVAAGRLWPLLPDALCPSYPIFLIARADPVRDTATELFLESVLERIGRA